MASEKYLPGLWKTVLNWLRVSAKPKSKINEPIFQGEDLNGNLYFETFDKYGRRLRTVEPKHVDTIAIPMLPEITISPEWIRWLRKTREDPPTEEEMIRNAAIAYIKKQRAYELESEERKNWPELDAKLKQLEAEKNYNPVSLFPTYRDLMLTPAQEYMNSSGFYIPDINENPNVLLEKQRKEMLSSGATNQEESMKDPVKLEATQSDRSQVNGESKSKSNQ